MKASAALLLATVMCAALQTLAWAEPLKLEPGKSLILACETQSVVVAPEAASSKGAMRLRLESKGAGTSAVWSVVDLAAAHTASFAARHRDGCAAGCALEGIDRPKTEGTERPKPLELWAPKVAAPASMPPTEPLTIAALDRDSLKLSASTFLDNQIAALEQGTCSVQP